MISEKKLSQRRTWGIGPRGSSGKGSGCITVALSGGGSVSVSKNISRLSWALSQKLEAVL